MNRILLLNPPASQRVERDYYCGHATKGRYYWPQIDLLVLSGLFRSGFDIRVLDAVVENLSVDKTLERIRTFGPDAVISLTAAVSWTDDIRFLEAMHCLVAPKILVSGDFPRAEPWRVIEENPFIDAVILDFTDAQIPEFLSDPQGNGFRNLHTRFSAPSVGKSKSGSFKYAVPLHEAFPLSRYHLPTILHHPFTVILSDFGCPYGCRFCYLQRVEHKLRDLENLREELEHIRRLGIRELLFMDASFGSSRKHTMRVCDLLQSVSNDFSWVCDMRVDAVDEQLLTAMKTAGCHTIMLGVETPNIEVLRRHGKPCSNEQTFEAFRLAARLGIRTLAHFIIGLSGETEESTENLIDFAIELDPTFASFNDARPVWNTTFREEVVNSGWVMDDGVEIGRGRFYPVWESPDLPRGTVWRLRNKAVRSFYLRPSYLLRQLAGIRTFYQMKTLLRQGLDTISEIFFSLLRRG